MIDTKQLIADYIKPAISHIDMWSQAAENLILGTIALESRRGTYLRQIKGPALGICQIEPATHIDAWENWIDYRPEISAKLLEMVPPMYRIPDATRFIPVDQLALIACPLYCIAIARIIYRRVSAPLPAANDWAGLEAYHKRHYNTMLGKTKPGEFIAAVQSAGIDTRSYA